ncbi:BppU family phage baseplate upper protein [Tetragenococcus muriaticus]|uniref:BppU N-terminal domain-containing protein n=1 Tax=Tetragenococcus muriaticus 3MR10-3 TaxID=1302648 RepID=A0A091C2U3_9ENTE|nr:BppU family phage baseplate upper protein [Tetragenococcus muriaticus]KFN92181.1 hypothetical protein TMU3MR103_0642 [Tetragenococcus muriaticus 3MR10-3]
MYKDKNELYKDVALEVSIDAKKGARNQEIETHATFYSYDVQSGLIKINIKKDNKPLPLPNGTQVLLNVVKLDLPQQKMVFTGDIVDSNNGIAHWVIPDELQGYKGAIRTGVFVKLPNDQSLHGGYFKFYMGISEIDENLEPFEENYWQGWHDFQKEAEQEWNAWKASRDKTWREHEEAYDEWKNQQKKAQFDFESNFVSWKTDINQTLETTDNQVQETNDALENLDAYSKQETDDKLAGKADKTAIDDLNKKVEIGEHVFLTPEKGFENYNAGNKGDVTSQLQYVRIGPLCKIFGTVKNLETIRSGAEVVVTTIPAKLSVNVVDIVRGETRNGNSFRARIYNYNNSSFPNQITISSPQNGDGSALDLSPGNWLNISLIAGIEEQEDRS